MEAGVIAAGAGLAAGLPNARVVEGAAGAAAGEGAEVAVAGFVPNEIVEPLASTFVSD